MKRWHDSARCLFSRREAARPPREPRLCAHAIRSACMRACVRAQAAGRCQPVDAANAPPSPQPTKPLIPLRVLPLAGFAGWLGGGGAAGPGRPISPGLG